MLNVKLLGFLLCLLTLAACSSRPATPDPAVIDAAVAATVGAQTVALQLAPPTLTAPAHGAVLNSPIGVVLTWEWERPLQPDEYYDVRVWREGSPHAGIAWTVVNEFDLTSWLSQQRAPGDFYWSVAVVAGKDGQVTKPTTDEAPRRKFTLKTTMLPTPMPTPAPTLEPTQAALLARGADMFLNGVEGLPSCHSCHRLDPVEVAVGPYLRGLFAMAGMRVAGLDAKAYVRQSIMEPNAYIVEGYVAGIMYPEYATRLGAEQIDVLVTYVLSLR